MGWHFQNDALSTSISCLHQNGGLRPFRNDATWKIKTDRKAYAIAHGKIVGTVTPIWLRAPGQCSIEQCFSSATLATATAFMDSLGQPLPLVHRYRRHRQHPSSLTTQSSVPSGMMSLATRPNS